jgi:hypothetical protein
LHQSPGNSRNSHAPYAPKRWQAGMPFVDCIRHFKYAINRCGTARSELPANDIFRPSPAAPPPQQPANSGALLPLSTPTPPLSLDCILQGSKRRSRRSAVVAFRKAIVTPVSCHRTDSCEEHVCHRDLHPAYACEPSIIHRLGTPHRATTSVAPARMILILPTV